MEDTIKLLVVYLLGGMLLSWDLGVYYKPRRFKDFIIAVALTVFWLPFYITAILFCIISSFINYLESKEG